jgi:PAS domain S-box-containing protein
VTTRILVTEDEPLVLRVFAKILAKPDREILCAAGAVEALAIAERVGRIDVALLDKNLGDGSGLDVARALRERDPFTQVILVTGYASVDSAVEAVRIGAYDYVTKPVADFAALDLKVAKAAERAELARDRDRLAAELAVSEERYREIHDAAHDAIVTFGAVDERIREVNPAAVALYGYSREELLALEVRALFAPPAPEHPGAWSDAASVLQRRKDGSTFAAELRPGDLVLGGEALRSFAIRDVSARERAERERRELEGQLRQVQKMEAVGQLAGGLAHDLGNMLAVVLASVELLGAAARDDQQEDLAAIRDAAQRGAALIRQLMSLSRRSGGAPSIVAPNEAVAEATSLLARALAPAARLETRLAPDAWDVHVDRGQLGQVLLNLVVNARDATPAGGRVVLSTTNVTVRNPAGGEPAEHVCLAVEDTGSGMTPEVLARAFEPFFTTKEPGKSTGLGLSVVYGIVQQAGGFVEAESSPGRGSTFRVYLPRSGGRGDRGGAAEPPPPVDLEAVTALVAEDEEQLRLLVVRALRGSGMRVLDGGGGSEALERARSHRGPIDLLVTDVVMPGMSGPELARALARERPRLKVLFTTAYPFAAMDGPDTPDHAVLLKPFKQSELLAAVRRLAATA